MGNLSKLNGFYFLWNHQKTTSLEIISGGIEVKLFAYIRLSEAKFGGDPLSLKLQSKACLFK